MNPLVSVIIANWNGLAFLKPCLAILRQQTFRSFEIIVVDNGSSDGSVAWLESQPGAPKVTSTQRLRMANAIGSGKTKAEVHEELNATDLSETEKEMLIPFKIFEGNKPTTSILIDKLTPKSLGKLIAMYEHKIFVQGIIWNIFSYDQFGVELGKKLAKTILSELNSHENSKGHDSSTKNLIDFFRKNQ